MFPEVSVLRQERLKLLKSDVLFTICMLYGAVLLLQVLFRETPGSVTVRLVLSFAFLYLLPGLVLTLPWRDALSFGEYLVFSCFVGMAAVSIISYYLGLIGFFLNLQTYVVPIALIIIAALIQKFTAPDP
jgi:uncharacterized membrane protein YjjP (DUF1212 family)